MKSNPQRPAVIRTFERNLRRCEPYMFNLAGQLLEAAPTADWNVLICDDTSGRLPTHFVRQVLGQAGHRPPTWFVAGSGRVRDNFGQAAYQLYFKTMAHAAGLATLRPLIVTESVGTGQTLVFLTSALQSTSEHVETASIISKTLEPTATYTGSHGHRPTADVYYTFEQLTKYRLLSQAAAYLRARLPPTMKNMIPTQAKRVGNYPASALLGTYVDPESGIPVARRHPETPTTAMAYQVVGVSADRFFALNSDLGGIQ